MTLDFQGKLYNSCLLGAFNSMEAAANTLGELAVLTNDPNEVTDTINESMGLMQELLEATLILDPDIEIELCPNCQADENNAEKESDTYPVFPAFIELNPDDKLLRATMGIKEGQIDYITDWVDYDPGAEVDLATSFAFKLLSEAIERRWRLSQIKEDNTDVS